MNCPTCQSDNTQRLQIIHQAGTQYSTSTSSSTVTSLGPSSAGPSQISTTTIGRSSTLLADKCAPPAQRSTTWAVTLISAGVSVYLFSKTPWISLCAAVTAVAGIVVLIRCRRYNNVAWPPLYQVWLRQWHCNRCGHVYAANP